ncbi:MAG: ATP-dependent helicase, partial [Anaerolineales bacterium]|nr:ATP-dependent helicase [Anaerolineales bacterium]
MADDEPLHLAPWQVNGWWLPAAEALALLSHLPLPQETPADLAIGVDSRYWHTVASLVLETLAQQKLVPALVQAGEHGKEYHARWLPVLDGPQDAARLAQLEAAMPPICRAAFVRAGARSFAPRALLDRFIKVMADAQARLWARPAPPTLDHGDVAQRWLRALFGDDARVAAAPAQLKALDRSVQAWLRNLHIAGAGDFRVAFWLTPPAPAGEGHTSAWQLHYVLQARADPSLLLPASDIRQTRGSVLHRLGHRLDRPQEQLLAALGYASRLFPPIGRSLREAQPTHLNLDTDEAFHFLREAAPLLEQGGFGVLVPPWWNQRGARLGMRLRVRPKSPAADQSVGRLGFDQLVAYRWELSVGDTTLTQEEFAALVALKTPLVPLRGQWVQLDSEQIEKALNFWQSQAWAGEASLLEALQMGLGAEDAVDGLPVEDVSYEDWLDGWLGQVTGQEKLAELPPPDGLRGQLRPYQRYGYSWLEFLRRWGLGACLADDMGLGKTVQTLALLVGDQEQGAGQGPVLLVCPTSVVGNWQKEIERFTPTLSAFVHRGNERLQGTSFATEAKQHDLVITSYALARRDAETLQAV